MDQELQAHIRQELKFAYTVLIRVTMIILILYGISWYLGTCGKVLP